MSQYIETIDDNNRICPYCGYSYQVEAENYSEDVRVEECDECGKKFYAQDDFTVTHYAVPDCILNGEQHKYNPNKKGGYYKFCSVCDKYEG